MALPPHPEGVLPMFPLGSVLFPGAVLPLHVFEPRYRVLVQTCLEHEPEFGVVLIERGSEVGGGDVRTGVGTVARIVQAGELTDGRWALVCVGTRRFSVDAWLPDSPYPLARVTPRDEGRAPDLTARVEASGSLLRRAFELHASSDPTRGPAGRAAADPLGDLADDPTIAAWQLCAAAPLGPLDRQRLLVLDDPAARLDALDDLVREVIDLLERQRDLGP